MYTYTYTYQKILVHRLTSQLTIPRICSPMRSSGGFIYKVLRHKTAMPNAQTVLQPGLEYVGSMLYHDLH